MRLGDLDALKAQLNKLPMMSNWGEAFMPLLIDEQPTIDAVPVVRCRECKHGKRGVDNMVRCSHPCGKVISMTAGDFCSYGQRKEAAND